MRGVSDNLENQFAMRGSLYGGGADSAKQSWPTARWTADQLNALEKGRERTGL